MKYNRNKTDYERITSCDKIIDFTISDLPKYYFTTSGYGKAYYYFYYCTPYERKVLLLQF